MLYAYTQHYQKVNVFSGIVDDIIIGPFFFVEPLTLKRYLHFWQNELIPDFTDIFPNENDSNFPNENTISARGTPFLK